MATETERQIRDYKIAIGEHLARKIENDQLSDPTIALVALTNVTAVFACMILGREMATDMLVEVSRKIDSIPDSDLGL